MSSVRETLIAMLVLIGIVIAIAHLLAGCTPNIARPAAYGAELEECSRKAATCDESIACENKVRARYGRPARTGGCE